MAKAKKSKNDLEKFMHECRKPSIATLILLVFVIVAVGTYMIGLNAGQSAGTKTAQFTLLTEPAKTAETAVAEKLPDIKLVVSSTFSGETKQAIRIATDVVNSGEADAKDRYAITYSYKKSDAVNYTKDGSLEISAPHKLGTTKSIAYLFVPMEVGTYELKTCADVEGKIKESDEANNCATSTITVKNFAKYA